MTVANNRRYVRGRRCPICDGADGDVRGGGRRCFGFIAADGDYAHCSREEMAGPIERSASETYGHRLAGSCKCGHAHAVPLDAAPSRSTDIGTVVATYDYHDESGALVYQVVRYTPKTFRQRRPDGSGGWINSLDAKDPITKQVTVRMRRVLYRLDRVREADPTQIVAVCEGEKDVHAMESLGFVATCNPGGAGKWSMVADCAKKALKGRHVIVIADADDKGKAHAADIEKRLRGIAASVRVIEPKRGHDAASWIELGGTFDEIMAVLPAVQPPDPSDFDQINGKPVDSQANMALALRKLGVTVRYDSFGDREIVERLAGFGPDLDDAAMNRLRLQIDSRFEFRIAKDLFYDVIADMARENSFNPVRDYLNALRWDGVPRLDAWLSTYAGADDTVYTRAVGRIVLVAAVHRVMQPGCKFDEMLILEGEQGTNKSTALSILAVNPAWFSDDLALGADTKRQMESTAGKWIVEAGELKGMSKGDVHALKGYLSRQHDEARVAYGRKVKRSPRQFVIIGTTNETADYFKDSTGNRRFWPVRVIGFDLERLRADRDQIWAEAAHHEAAGASIRLDPSLYAYAAAEQEDRRIEDSIDMIVGHVFGEATGRIHTVEAWKVLGIEGRPLNQDENQRFGVAMRRLGWQREQRSVNGARSYYYVRGSEYERGREMTVSGRGAQAFLVPTAPPS